MFNFNSKTTVRNSIESDARLPQIFAWAKHPKYEASETDCLMEAVWAVASALRKEGYGISREVEDLAYRHVVEVVGNGPLYLNIVQAAARRFMLGR